VVLKCPACGKTDLTADQAGCPRCGCDLRDLWAVAASAAQHLRMAIDLLQAGNREEALSHAETSWTLRHSREAAQAAFLASVCLEKSADGPGWRRRLQEPFSWMGSLP